MSQLPKRLLYASGDPRDDNLFRDSSLKTIVWSTECLTKGDVMSVSDFGIFYYFFVFSHAKQKYFVVLNQFDSC